jgi:hypothetical protein
LLALNFSSQIRETDDLDIFAFLAIAQQEYRSSLPGNNTYARVISEIVVLYAIYYLLLAFYITTSYL